MSFTQVSVTTWVYTSFKGMGFLCRRTKICGSRQTRVRSSVKKKIQDNDMFVSMKNFTFDYLKVCLKCYSLSLPYSDRN